MTCLTAQAVKATAQVQAMRSASLFYLSTHGVALFDQRLPFFCAVPVANLQSLNVGHPRSARQCLSAVLSFPADTANTMSEPDLLFTVRNFFYLGAYQAATAEASDLEGLSESVKVERDAFVYRSYIELGSYEVQPANPAKQAILPGHPSCT